MKMMHYLFPVIVTFTFSHPDPTSVNSFKLFKASTEAALGTGAPVATLTRTGTPASFSVSYDVTDPNPMYFGVSASNNFGDSLPNTKKTDGSPMLLGKPSAPTTFTFSVP